MTILNYNFKVNSQDIPLANIASSQFGKKYHISPFVVSEAQSVGMDVYKGLAYNQLPPTHIYVLKYVCCKSFQEFQGGPGPNKSHQTTFRSTSYFMPPWLFSLSIFVTISHILKICDLGFPSACWLVW